MYELLVRDTFSAAHNLRDYEGKCENLHGHNWKVEASVKGAELGGSGMLLDFKLLKGALGEIIEAFDHKYLNEDVAEFKRLNPTTENLAAVIYKKLGALLPEGVAVNAVTVWESEHCSATYTEGDG